MGQPLPQEILYSKGTFRLDKLFGYECCYCTGIDNTGAMDLHEILFSRKSVMGAGHEATMAIMDRRNCGWIHRRCHHKAEGGEGRLKTIRYLLRYEGYVNVMNFIGLMTEIMKQPLIEYSNDLNKVMRELALEQDLA